MIGVRFQAYLLVLKFLALTLCAAQYLPPDPEIVPLYPVGIRISIPDEDGISLVAVHAKFNQEFNGLEAGTIAWDIKKVKNGRWTYEDRSTRLKIGDIIYLWIHVVYEGLGYNRLGDMLQVTELYRPDGTKQPGVTTTSTSTTTQSPRCERSKTIHNGQHPCAGQLLFEEHFDQPLTNQWRILKEFSSAPDYEFVVYQDREENVRVKDGELRIRPTLLERQYTTSFVRHGTLVIPNCTSRFGSKECERTAYGHQILPPVSSGQIDTKNTFSFLYGRVEIKAKLPRGDWIYPILMLKPVDSIYGVGYHSGQLRIASVVGNQNLLTNTSENYDGHILRAGAVVSTVGPIREETMSKKTSDNYWSNDYHVYELEWSETKISVKVDGVAFGTKENPAVFHRHDIFKNLRDIWEGQNPPFNKPFYLSLGVAAGGNEEFPDGSISGTHIKPWRKFENKAVLNFFNAEQTWIDTWEGEASTLKVDYVKIWAL